VEDYLLVSTINVVVAQRLVRRICPYCKEEFVPPEEVQEEMKGILHALDPTKVATSTRDKTIIEALKKITDPELKVYRGKGCDKCGNTGYHGRVGIFEVLNVSEAISDMILEHASANRIDEQATKEGMISLQQDGVLRVLEGATTLEEVMRVIK
jgi:type II secretory ATPase GspE/PulE/Tfp pilus assembly ATPase PilB-like protein